MPKSHDGLITLADEPQDTWNNTETSQEADRSRLDEAAMKAGLRPLLSDLE